MKCWAITGQYGFYYNSCARTRREAIRDHVEALYGGGEWQGFGRPLSGRQKAWWAECKSRGDRCVKVEIVEVPA